MDPQWDRREMETECKGKVVTWNPIDKEQEGTLRGQVRRRTSQDRKGTGTSGELKPRLSGALLFP